MIKSLSPMIFAATVVPLTPRTPHDSGWESGRKPFARYVVATGSENVSANSRTCFIDRRHPSPIIKTGFFADFIKYAAASASSKDGLMSQEGENPAVVPAFCASATCATCMSSGSIICDGDFLSIALLQALEAISPMFENVDNWYWKSHESANGFTSSTS